MAKLEENVFKPEEELQGYIAGEADADTFLLAENDEYPGMVPDFGSAPEKIEVKPEVAVFEDEKTEKIEEPEEIDDDQDIEEFVTPEDSLAEDVNEELDLNIDIDDDDLSDVWSAFGAPEDDEEEIELPEKAGITEEEVELPEKAGITEEEVELPEKAGITEEEVELPEKAGITEEEVATPTTEKASSAIEDDEFKKFLEAQQEKAHAQRKIVEEDEAPPNRNSNAEPIFVEITGDDFQEKKKEPEPEAQKEPKRVKEKKEKPEKEEKKRKGAAGWLVAAVLLLIIGLFTVGLLITDNDSEFLKLVSSMTSKTENQIMPADTTEDISEDTTQKQDKIVDFSDTTQAETTEEVIDETTDITEKSPAQEVEKEEIEETQKTPRQKTISPKRQSKIKSVETKISTGTVESKTTAYKTQETESQGIIKRVYEPTDITNNIATPSAKESMIVRTTQPMESEKAIKSKTIKQDAIEKQILPSLDRNKGVFSVQVYSTLSKKDATDKVKQLKNMNIKNVYISEYRKRDVLWYRVRYGEFESYEQAQQEAKNRGFSDAWIDRVK